MESNLHEKDSTLKNPNPDLYAASQRIKELEDKIAALEETRAAEVESMGRVLISKTIEAGELEAEVEKLKSQLSLIDSLENELEKHKEDLQNMQKNNKQLSGWMQQLKKEYNDLLSTRRWRTGNFLINIANKVRFKSETPKAVERMNNIFGQFENWNKQQAASFKQKDIHSSMDAQKLSQILQQLLREMDELFKTRRWKIGNAIGRISSTLTGRDKTPKSVTNIEMIKANFQSMNPHMEIYFNEIQYLSRQIEEIRKNYLAILASRRWRMGDKIVSAVNKIMFRNKPPKAVKRINDHLTRYDKWKETNI